MVGGPYSATAWLRLAPPEQVIEPGASATVRFSAALPAVVEPGGYRTGILFEFEPASGAIAVAPAGARVQEPHRDPDLRQRRIAGGRDRARRRARAADAGWCRHRGDGQELGPPDGPHQRHARAVRRGWCCRSRGGRSRRSPAARERTRGLHTCHRSPLRQAQGRPLRQAQGRSRRHRSRQALYRAELKLDLGLPAIIIGETPVRIPR